MPQPTQVLEWDTDYLSKSLRRQGIRNRAQLAQRLGVARPTVNRTLDADWRGTATPFLLVRLVEVLGLRVDKLVRQEGREVTA